MMLIQNLKGKLQEEEGKLNGWHVPKVLLAGQESNHYSPARFEPLLGQVCTNPVLEWCGQVIFFYYLNGGIYLFQN